jgi:hypothetical protein
VHGWQRSALAWLVLVWLAVGIWAAGDLIGDA